MRLFEYIMKDDNVWRRRWRVTPVVKVVILRANRECVEKSHTTMK